MIKSAAVFLLVASGLASTAVADGRISVSVEFSDIEVSIIRDYYRDHDKQSHKGKKDHKSLPPGIAKNLQRGKPLPPGIAKQVLPSGLHVLLPPAPHGYERIVVAGKILLISIATQVIHDILDDLMFG